MNIKLNSFILHNDYPTTAVIDGVAVRVEPLDGCYANGYIVKPISPSDRS